ncbi:MAG: CtsR family transcriptional regulator [Clostridiales bacterium]|nr:CtsR family transcriptional regulator [Clostridiales bacterium]
MKISDLVANYILNMINEGEGNAEIKRNELATMLGCVPSQINYVITSRFTPEQGFIVESRRGGGGYIRISRVNLTRSAYLMHIVNSIGVRLDNASACAIIDNLSAQGVIDEKSSALMKAALSDKAYAEIPVIYRDVLRAAIFKNMLIAQSNNI